MNHTELSIEPPQIYNSLLEANKAMLGNIMIDLEGMDYRVKRMEEDGAIRLYKDDGICKNIGEIIHMSAWIDLEDFSSLYEIKEMEV